MKRVVLLALLAASIGAAAQQEPSKPVEGGRLFLPKNWIWAWTQFDIAPPHNEPDPNLCGANAGDFGGKNRRATRSRATC